MRFVKILYLVPRQVYDTKMARERFEYMKAFLDPNHVLVMSGPGWSGWNGEETAADNARRLIDTKMRGKDAIHGDCDLVHTYMVDGLAGLSRDVAVCISYNEANKVERVNAEVERNQPTYVVFHYANDLPRYPHFARWGVERVHVPHCATYHVPEHVEKDIDVLIVGNLNADIYPFRVRLAALALRVLRKRGYKVVALGHPGYDLSKQRAGTVVGYDYASVLARSRLVFTCSSRFRYALTKFSEIAMCRSLAVSDVPEQSPEHFIETTCAFPTSALDEDILRGVELLLDNPEECARRTTDAYDKTALAYTLNHYAAMFVKAYRAGTGRAQ